MSLWTRIRLWFVRPYYGIDVGRVDGDYTVKLTFKNLNGITYVVDEEITK